MPKAVYHAYGYVKKAAALVNAGAGRLTDAGRRDLIAAAADEVIAGELDDEFPLYVWQTGSGTQSNMNVNEVIANRGIQLLGGAARQQGAGASQRPRQHGPVVQRHVPDRDAHRGRARDRRPRCCPRSAARATPSEAKAGEWADVVKIGRTHLQDATPADRRPGVVGLGRPAARRRATGSSDRWRPATSWPSAAPRSAPASTRPPASAEQIAARARRAHRPPFVTAPNKFAAQGSLDAMVARQRRRCAASRSRCSRSPTTCAGSRPGPRAGLHELRLPANEPGSSIMPGKVNPTQAEAMLMVCLQVIGDDSRSPSPAPRATSSSTRSARSSSTTCCTRARILGDAASKLPPVHVEGAELDRDQDRRATSTLADARHRAQPDHRLRQGLRDRPQGRRRRHHLREAALALGVSAADFDRIVDPQTMVGHPHAIWGWRSLRRAALDSVVPAVSSLVLRIKRAGSRPGTQDSHWPRCLATRPALDRWRERGSAEQCQSVMSARLVANVGTGWPSSSCRHWAGRWS